MSQLDNRSQGEVQPNRVCRYGPGYVVTVPSLECPKDHPTLAPVALRSLDEHQAEANLNGDEVRYCYEFPSVCVVNPRTGDTTCQPPPGGCYKPPRGP